MSLQLSVDCRNALLDAIETTIDVSPNIKIRSGTVPASCASADSGTELAVLTLPSDWLADAAAGAKAKSGTFEDLSAENDGDAEHFRLYDSGGTCHMQGTVTATGGGGDMTVDNITFATGQHFTITTFTLNAGNA